MTESICKMFHKNIELLSFCNNTVTYLRFQNYYRALHFSTMTIDALMIVIEDAIINQSYFNESSLLVDNHYINQMLIGLLEAQENKDYILLADLLEMQLNPFIISLQEFIIYKEEHIFDEEQYKRNINLFAKKYDSLCELLKRSKSPLELLEEGYSVEYTSSGLKTLALFDENRRYYMHSNGQVLHESGMLAREWFSNDASEYILYGLGFGYHVMELMELDASITIRVYESDLNIIQLACAFSDLSSLLSSDRVYIIYDPYFKELSAATRKLKEDVCYVLHYPSLRNIKDKSIREQLEDYFISYSSVNNQLHSLNSNFGKNILHYDKYVDDLKEQFVGKDLYIIAAGPSLDKNYMQLSKIKENSIILATGTVFKKLLNAGIMPNYVIIIDANPGVYKQIESIETTRIPLLYLSTLYNKVPEYYQGRKYLICQKGYKKAEEYANKMNYNLYHTGGSVSTIALDLGIQFGCRRIIYIGLDLAYSDNMDHASDTESVNAVTQSDLRQVKDIYGNMVGTSKNLDIYRKWIEKRIKDVKGTEFIDATEGGAQIMGMKIKKLKNVIISY